MSQRVTIVTPCHNCDTPGNPSIVYETLFVHHSKSLICCEIAQNNSPRAGCEQNPSFSGSDIWIDPRLSL